jgi:putative redox protein
MDAKVTWSEGLSFSGTALGSGYTLPMGSSIEQGGKNDGFRPMELILVGLAGCTAMDVISILAKKKQAVSNFEVLVHGDRAETHPHIFNHILVEYVVTGKNIQKDAVERAVELSETKYCSASGMLSKVAVIENKITIHQEE